MKPSEVAEHLETCIKAKRPPFIWGAPGIGKSDVVAQVAKKLKRNLIDVRALLLDPVDLRGIPVTVVADTGIPVSAMNYDAGKSDAQKAVELITQWAAPAFLPRKKGALIFFDELNAAPPLVQAACYQLVLDRRVGEYTLPDDAVIIAAGNRETDRAVTSRMPSPLANRFIHLDFETDLKDWIVWARLNKVAEELIAFLRWRTELLHSFDPKRNDKAFPTPRSWYFVDQLVKAAGKVDFGLVAATVGEGAASEFVGFMDVYHNLPDPDLVIASPMKADVPSEPNVLYAICSALSNRVTKKNFANIVKYANRLPVEFSVLLVRDCVEHEESVVGDRAFVEWSSEHADVLM